MTLSNVDTLSRDLFEPLSSNKWVQARKKNIDNLIDNWLLSDDQYRMARSLTFTDQNIIDDYLSIKRITELLSNNFGVEFIDIISLKSIVRDKKQNISLIIDELRKIIVIDRPRMWYTTLLLSILDIKNNS